MPPAAKSSVTLYVQLDNYSLRYCEWHHWKERKRLPLFEVTPPLKSYEMWL